MIRRRLDLAGWLDRTDAQIRRLGERIGWRQPWLDEFRAYRADPRLTLEEFWVRYTLLRMNAQPLLTETMTEADALRFYRSHDYMLWRNVVHRRHSAWRRVLWTMPQRYGDLLEFGCGIAPVTTWVKAYRPHWRFSVVDLPDSPHFSYACWRVRDVECGRPPYDVITALDVFEHLTDPLVHARRLVHDLSPDGYLHSTFVAEHQHYLDLAAAHQREETFSFLTTELETVWERQGYRVSRKRRR